MFERFTDRARKVIALSNQEAQRFNHEYIGTEHMLLGLIKEGSGVGANVLKNLGVSLARVRTEVEKLVKSGPEMVTVAKLPQTPRAKRVIEYAIEESRGLEHNYVGTEHVLLGLLREEDGVAAQVLMNLGVKLEEVREEVLNLLGAGQEDDQTAAAPLPTIADVKDLIAASAVAGFGRDLTQLARQGKLEPVLGRDHEIDRVVRILCRREQNRSVLVGPTGVGKRHVAYGLAHRIISQSVPPGLMNVRLVALDLTRLLAGVNQPSGVEERLVAIAKETRRAGDIILFIEETHAAIDPAGPLGAIGCSGLLGRVLLSEDVRFIAASSPDAYRDFIVPTALSQRIDVVQVGSMSAEQTLDVLRGLRQRFEQHHKIEIPDTLLEAVVQLANWCLPKQPEPAAAVSLLDDACAHIVARCGPPPDLAKVQAAIQQLLQAKDEAVRQAAYERGAELRDEIARLRRKSEALLHTHVEGSEPMATLGDDDLIAVLVERTGIPADQIRARDLSAVPLPPVRVGAGLPRFEHRQCDTVLPGCDIRITPGTGVVLLPQSAECQTILESAIRPAMQANDIEPYIAGDIYQPGAVLNQVWEHIRTAEVIVADVSGGNSNVAYVLGLCFGLHRCPIILARTRDELPFNLRTLRYLEYEDSAAGAQRLRDDLTATLRALLVAMRTEPPSL